MRRIQVFVWCVVAGAVLAALALGLFARETIGGRDLIAAAMVMALVGMARSMPVQLAPRTLVLVDNAASFAAVLLFPAPVAVAITALALGASAVYERGIRLQKLFNVGQGVLAVAAGSAVTTVLMPDGIAAVGDTRLVGTAILAAFAMWATNVVLVDAVVALQQRRPLFERWWANHQRFLWPEVSLFLLGFLAALVTARHVWALLLLVVPSVLIYRSLRDGVALKFQTRRALEELADIVDLRDRYTHGHCRRVAEMCSLLARQLRLPPDQVERISMAARIHDVGKIGIKSTVLMKPGHLTDIEWIEMRSHPEVGARLVERFPEFTDGCEMVLSHHERWDGSGYPRRLAGERIPLGARVIAVTDTWDAMVSHRSYRRAMEIGAALAEMERGRGTQFDPKVLDAFLLMLREHPELARQHTDIEQDIDVADTPALALPLRPVSG